MKKLFFVILLILIQLPVGAVQKKMLQTNENGSLPNIFIYSIPDNEENIENKDNNINKTDCINKTSPDTETESANVYATKLKGYAEYIENLNEIHLSDDNKNFVLNIRQPQRISGIKGMAKQPTDKKPILQYISPEYSIAPASITTDETAGNFTFGTMYGNGIDTSTAMLETETGLFTRYEKSSFALSSSVKKSLNTTNAIDYSTFSVAPELKVNNYLSLKNVLSTDVTRNRRSSALVFSLNPLGKKDIDRVKFELGAKQTYFLDSDTNKTEFSFSTIFKL